MSIAHIKLIRKELERTHWIITSELTSIESNFDWLISRPNGDTKLTIEFQIGGNGPWGEILGNETIINTIGCKVLNHSEIDIYFGKFQGRFQKDLKKFIINLNKIEHK